MLLAGSKAENKRKTSEICLQMSSEMAVLYGSWKQFVEAHGYQQLYVRQYSCHEPGGCIFQLLISVVIPVVREVTTIPAARELADKTAIAASLFTFPVLCNPQKKKRCCNHQRNGYL